MSHTHGELSEGHDNGHPSGVAANSWARTWRGLLSRIERDRGAPRGAGTMGVEVRALGRVPGEKPRLSRPLR